MTRCATLVFALALGCASGGEPDRPASTLNVDTESSTGNDATTDVTDSGDDDGPGACVPGQQIACACPLGSQGAQACNASGTGYGPCECPGADDEASGSSGSGASDESGESGESTTTDPSDTVDPTGECPPDAACDACVVCSVESVCKELYTTCTGEQVCNDAANCVIMCGFNPTCATKCAPEPDSEVSEPYQALIECLGGACPQCLEA